MKVLHVYRTYFPDTQGGLEEVIRQICQNTKDLGVQSRVFAPSRSSSDAVISREEATVVRPKLTMDIASCGISLEALRTFPRIAAWADILHYHFPWPFADVLHLTSGMRKPVVITYHSDIVRQRFLRVLYQPLMDRFLNSADRIVCTSPNYLATSKVLARHSDKVDVIPIGLDEASYRCDPAGAVETAERFGSDFFLFVGVLRYYKGLHILLDAIKDAPYDVVIVGSGPTEPELKRQAKRLNLTNVTFTGYLPDQDKLRLLQLCRGVVFPSYLRSEAFGVTLLEGAMFGKPLISTEVGSGTSHVNIDGHTGIVIPPGSRSALREAMDYLWSHPEAGSEMGRNARLRYEEHFTGSTMGRRYFELYSELLGE